MERTWNRGPAHWLQRPVRAGRLLAGSAWVAGTSVDPARQQGNLFGGQRIALGRHSLAHFASHMTNQRAFGAFPGDNALAATVASLESRDPVIQPVAAPLLVWPVALQATGFQKRSDISLKIHGWAGARIGHRPATQ